MARTPKADQCAIIGCEKRKKIKRTVCNKEREYCREHASVYDGSNNHYGGCHCPNAPANRR
jgi:hypothetical protein